MRDDTRRRLVSRQNVSAGNQAETEREGEGERKDDGERRERAANGDCSSRKVAAEYLKV